MAIPVIDERIKTIGPGTLRKMDALKLRSLRDLLVIQVNDEPLAVMIPYEMYLEMQQEVVEGQKAVAAKTAEFEEAFSAITEKDIVAPSSAPPAGFRGIPFFIEEPPPPFQGKSRTASPIDQIHEKDSGWVPNEPLIPIGFVKDGNWTCQHCGATKEHIPGTAPGTLCQECFMAGHRAVANCQQCAEQV